MDTPESAAPEYDPGAVASNNEVRFFNGVMAHVVGTLLAWSLGLLIWLMYRLWEDYISTILTAFIVSQTLHAHRAQLVGGLRWLRAPTSPPLRSVVFAALHPSRLLRTCYNVPALLQLAVLLASFLVIGAVDSVYNRLLILVSLVGPAVTLLLLTVVLDKRLLMFNALVSDEVLAATLVLTTIIGAVSFVAISLSVQSVLDAVQLLYTTSTWMPDVSEGAIAAQVRASMGDFVQQARTGLQSLRRAEHKWVPVATHLLDHLESNSTDTNGTTVVMSTFDKLRETYPEAQWLEQAQDLGRLVLWAAHKTSGAAAAAGVSMGSGLMSQSSVSQASQDRKTCDASAGAGAGSTRGDACTDGQSGESSGPGAEGETSPGPADGGAGGAGGLLRNLNFTHVVEEGRKLVRELVAELENPAEFMAMLRSQVERLSHVLPSLRTSGFGSQIVVLISWLLSRSYWLLHLVFALSGTTIVFLTMTFYMLSSERDVLTLLVRPARWQRPRPVPLASAQACGPSQCRRRMPTATLRGPCPSFR